MQECSVRIRTTERRGSSWAHFALHRLSRGVAQYVTRVKPSSERSPSIPVIQERLVLCPGSTGTKDITKSPLLESRVSQTSITVEVRCSPQRLWRLRVGTRECVEKRSPHWRGQAIRGEFSSLQISWHRGLV